jgi:hyaluronan synthase
MEAIAPVVVPSIPAVSEPPRMDAWDALCFGAVSCGLVVVILAGFHGAFQSLRLLPVHHPRLWMIYRPSVLWTGLGACLLIFRSITWMFYRTPPVCALEKAPMMTVVIPAYNEGKMVASTVDSVVQARYLRSRLEIIVIDDGSRDDTWEHIQAAARRYPGLVTPLRFLRNQGKRAALNAGFRRARGEVIVTVDSDSSIEKETLLAMAGPFQDPKVGAVAGKVMVLNRRQGLIPRMLQVQFILAFDLVRAVQSTYGVVQCCPGALSAYRAAALYRVLDAWTDQTFLGRRCTYGEDRSLTNFVLDLGYDVLYQRKAVVHTLVPITYDKLCRMYLRWERSNIQEFFRFLPIAWKRPLKVRLIALFDIVISNLRYVVWYMALALLVLLCVDDPFTLPRVLAAIGLMSLFNMLHYLRSERSTEFIYGIFYSYFSFFGLSWIFLYALLTVRSRSWMTR